MERGVQTDLAKQASSPAISPSLKDVLLPQNDVEQPAIEPSSTTSTHSRSSTHFDSAYSGTQTDMSFDSGSSEANQSMTTTTRAYKREQLPANRPTSLLERQSSLRVLSLPEATPKFRMKNVLGKKTTRVVSMPAATPRDVSDSLDISTHAGDPFGSEDEERTRVRVKSQATDVPYTPSAPSSPDSVVIIADSGNQLSTDFLRPRPDDSSSESDNEGWLTWAESPPRPIPALHGPLSLPYARCPSGAEGTIIEEPESLPRVIWGLDTEDAKSTRQSHAGSSRPLSRKSGLSTDVHIVQKPNLGPKSSITHEIKVAHPQAALREPLATQDTALNPLPQPPDFILKHSEPIDLERLVDAHSDTAHRADLPKPIRPPSKWKPSSQCQLPTPELAHDLSPELQAMLFAQGRLKTQGLPHTVLDSSRMNGVFRRSSAEFSISLMESIKSSRSPIVLDDLASPSAMYSQSLSSQLSALDMLQKHRQQQLNGLLPTPPSSTSPIWSSSFSPYQGGLLSPELLAAAGLSQLDANYLSCQAFMPGLDPQQQTMKSTIGAMPDYVLGSRKLDVNGLAPAAHINGHTNNLPPRLVAEYTRRRRGAQFTADSKQPPSGNGGSRHLSSPVRGVVPSPAVPKPPPNTPYSTKSGSAPSGRRAHTEISLPAAPLSPTSPHESLGLSQSPRSIPLSRLIQRRLSIVPEEEYAPSADNDRVASTPARTAARESGPEASGLHLYLSPPGQPNINAVFPGLIGNTPETQHRADGTGVTADRTATLPAQVKLPGVEVRALGPRGREKAQVVKEAHRRQRSANNSEDRHQRYEGGRGRGQRRGGRGRRGRGGSSAAGNIVYGAERVDGGLVVKS
ncbi:hypothetical protein BD414DRAFT_413132 [Trametes punicea]|nr:hypothetical protein BD414DRAFT_413132 [Trametes punicea]